MNFRVPFALLLLIGLGSFAQAMPSTPRTVMVELFEWPWKDVARECEVYLGPNGFSAVQVSPPQEHLSMGKGVWWERYQPVSYQIASRSGTEAEFQDMTHRCRAAGVEIYVDTVLNHMAGMASGSGFAGTSYTKYNHVGLYGINDFHHCGRNGNDQIVNFNDRFEVQNCELLGLSDLKTESLTVQQSLAEYMNHLLSLGASGFRLDAAKHVPAADLISIVSLVKSLSGSSPFIVSETSIGVGEPIGIDEYLPLGHVNFFRYPYDVGGAFNSGKISSLPSNFIQYVDTNSSVIFLENHDLQRTESSVLVSYKKTPIAYQLASVFFLTWPYGYPQIFSGYDFSSFDQGPPIDSSGSTLPILDSNNQCQAPWLCEHRLPGIAELVKFRNYTDSAFYVDQTWTGSPGQLAYGRGKLGFVAINASETQSLTAQISTNLSPGCYCNVIASDFLSGSTSCLRGINVSKNLVNISLLRQSALVLRSDIKCQNGSHQK